MNWGWIMKKVLRYLDDHLEEIFIATMMGYFCIVTILQVVFRFLLKSPAAWTEETARYSFIWMTYVGTAYATKHSTHIRVDALDNLVGPKGKEVLWWVSQTFFLIFVVILTKIGFDMLISLQVKPQTSPALKIPMQSIYACMPVGMGITVFRVIQNFILKIKGHSIRKDEGTL